MDIRKQKRKLNDLNEGLLPPQSLELEEAILGACMLEREAVGVISNIVTAETFYKPAHTIIYTAILELYKGSYPIDILTVFQKLKTMGKIDEVGGAVYITSLTNKVASSANIEYHARIIVQYYLKRKLIQIGQQSVSQAYDFDADVFDVYERNVQQLESTLTAVMKYEVSDIATIHNSVLAESYKVAISGVKSGVITGFRNLDNFTNGWQKSDLIIIAGRPGMGKSVCALAFALNPALINNVPTAIFSLEMSKEQVVGRAQSNLSGINSSSIIKKQLTVDEIDIIDKKCKSFATAPIYIDDTPAMSVMELKGKARKLVRDKGVKLIVIDYLQLMVADVGKGNREQEISKISQGLKALAKELNVPIIALSQLSRAVESRGGDKKPLLSDLRESGSIEQDADMVIFCYRPEYYAIDTYELGGETLDCNGLMCLIVAKHRAGSLGELRFGFNGELTKLENYDSFIDDKVMKSQIVTSDSPIIYNSSKSIKENTDFLNTIESNTIEDDMPF